MHRSTHDEGFTAADALVGVLVISLTVALSLQAQSVARRLSTRALEYRQATALAAYLATTAMPAQPGGAPAVARGAANGLTWTSLVEPAAGPGGEAAPATKGSTLCWRTITITGQGLGRNSGRRFTLDQIEPCAEDQARG